MPLIQSFDEPLFQPRPKGRACHEMLQFFQRYIDRNELKAEQIELGKRRVLNLGDERVRGLLAELGDDQETPVRIELHYMVPTLTPVNRLKGDTPYLLTDIITITKYFLGTENHNRKLIGSGFSKEGHGHTILEQLVQDFNARSIQRVEKQHSRYREDVSHHKGYNWHHVHGLDIPLKHIVGRLRVDFGDVFEGNLLNFDGYNVPTAGTTLDCLRGHEVLEDMIRKAYAFAAHIKNH